MTTPKPSPSWGAWRYERIRIAGRTVMPVSITERERREIVANLTSTNHELKDMNIDDNSTK